MDQGARMVTIDKEGNNNPFAFKKSDVEQGDSGLITGVNVVSLSKEQGRPMLTLTLTLRPI